MKLGNGALDLDLSSRIGIVFEGNVNSWNVFKVLIREKKYLDLKADIEKVQMLLKIKSSLVPNFKTSLLEKANLITQDAVNIAIEDIIDNTLIAPDAAEMTEMIKSHSADANNAEESTEAEAILDSALLCDMSTIAPHNIVDMAKSISKTLKKDKDEGSGEWLSDSDSETSDSDTSVDSHSDKMKKNMQTKNFSNSSAKPAVVVTTGNILMNEFENMNEIIYGMLPLKLLFSEGLLPSVSGKSSQINRKNLHHMMHQPYGILENDTDLNCYAFNAHQRHVAISECKLMASSRSSKFQEFNSVLKLRPLQFPEDLSLEIFIPSFALQTRITAAMAGATGKVVLKYSMAMIIELFGI
ncbi:hypothetical protein HK100_004385 [Physocladia obscura]|uniref:Uncharacterized protein n=1 Tax=Physocladia obscura TaxID=109957 RepID=A0AAD5XD08_9FUNG|nr:hypothetical protein HK100_004385 [Physocladia obscura]